MKSIAAAVDIKWPQQGEQFLDKGYLPSTMSIKHQRRKWMPREMKPHAKQKMTWWNSNKQKWQINENNVENEKRQLCLQNCRPYYVQANGPKRFQNEPLFVSRGTPNKSDKPQAADSRNARNNKEIPLRSTNFAASARNIWNWQKGCKEAVSEVVIIDHDDHQAHFVAQWCPLIAWGSYQCL